MSTDAETTSTARSLLEIADRFTLAPIRDALIDLDGLPTGERLLIYVGYALMLGLVAVAVVTDWIGVALLAVAYPAPGDVTRTIPWLALGACTIGFVTGWAYLLLAATRLPGAAAAVLVVLFMTQITLARSFDIGTMLARLPYSLAAGLAIAGAVVWLRRSSRSAGLWVVFSGLMALCAMGFWLTGDAIERAAQVHNFFGLAFYASLPIWLLSGLALVTLGAALAAGIVGRLRDSYPPRALSRTFAAVVFGHPLLVLVLSCPIYALLLFDSLAYQVMGAVLVVDGVLTLLLALIGLAMVVFGWWQPRRAAVLLALRLTLAIFLLGLMVALFGEFNLADPFLGAVEQLRIIPAGFFFMLTLVLSVLGFFIPFANGRSPHLPRLARIPLSFGAAILVTTTFFFMLHAKEVPSGAEVATQVLYPLFFLGAAFLGLPWLIYTLACNRVALVGAPELWEQHIAEPTQPRLTRRALRALIIGLPLFVFVVSCCGINLFLAFMSALQS
jgi:hypothetical protein